MPSSYDPGDYTKLYPTGSDFMTGFRDSYTKAHALEVSDRAEKEVLAAQQRKTQLQNELHDALQRGDHQGALAAATQLASGDEALKALQAQPEIDHKNESAVADDVVPYARQYLQFPDGDLNPDGKTRTGDTAKKEYINQNRDFLIQKGVPAQLLDGLVADPSNPALVAHLRALTQHGYDQHNYVNDVTGRINADTGAKNARFQKVGAGDTVYDVDQGKPVYGAPNETQDYMNPGVNDPRTGGVAPTTPTAPTPTTPTTPTAPAPAPATQANYENVVRGNETPNRSDYQANGNPWVSPKGARFQMQVMPSTAHDPGFGITPVRNESPEEYDRVGREYLAVMRRKYDDDPRKILAAYNAGPNRVDRAVQLYGDNFLARLPHETREYVAKGLTGLGSQVARATPTDANAVGGGDMPTEAPQSAYGAGGWVSKTRPQKTTPQWVDYTNPNDPKGYYQREASTGQVKRISSGPKQQSAKPETIAAAQQKYTATFRVEKKLNELDALGKKVLFKGPIGGLVPDVVSKTLDPNADAYDRTFARVINDVTFLTRIPGIGSQSDYEARLAVATAPDRLATPEGRQQSTQDLLDLVHDIRRDQASFLQHYSGNGGNGGNAPQRTVTRTGKTRDGRKVTQYSDGSIVYGK
jgi:hypothetical protein